MDTSIKLYTLQQLKLAYEYGYELAKKDPDQDLYQNWDEILNEIQAHGPNEINENLVNTHIEIKTLMGELQNLEQQLKSLNFDEDV